MGAVVAVLMMMTVTPAQAASLNILCTGFTGCLTVGRSDAGYGQVYGRSFWSMTAGHNCTNYAAYRLTHGRLVARPPDTRNASTWGPAARKVGIPVVDTPRVGDIAWWDASDNGASTSGHVAYVELVLLNGTVLVSEDNFNGDFRWRLMTKGSSTWPTGFIRYPESDGSPAGAFTSATSPEPGQLNFWGTSTDPDAPSGTRSYVVTLGGPRGTPDVETFTFGSPYFRFNWIKSVRTRGTVTMYLYALNTAGTAGSDTLLGHRQVSIKSASSVKSSFVDATVRRTTQPVVRFYLAPSAGRGTVDIVRGTTLLKRISVTTSGLRSVTLPRQPVGKWTVKVKYRGSSTYLPSSKSLGLAVR